MTTRPRRETSRRRVIAVVAIALALGGCDGRPAPRPPPPPPVASPPPSTGSSGGGLLGKLFGPPRSTGVHSFGLPNPHKPGAGKKFIIEQHVRVVGLDTVPGWELSLVCDGGTPPLEEGRWLPQRDDLRYGGFDWSKHLYPNAVLFARPRVEPRRVPGFFGVEAHGYGSHLWREVLGRGASHAPTVLDWDLSDPETPRARVASVYDEYDEGDPTARIEWTYRVVKIEPGSIDTTRDTIVEGRIELTSERRRFDGAGALLTE